MPKSVSAALALVAFPVVALLVGTSSVWATGEFPAVDALPDHPEMPDPLVFADGHRVASPADWPQRRAEMRKTIEYYLTGTMPPPPDNVRGEELEHRDIADGKVHFSRVKLTFGPESKLG